MNFPLTVMEKYLQLPSLLSVRQSQFVRVKFLLLKMDRLSKIQRKASGKKNRNVCGAKKSDGKVNRIWC